MLMMDWLRFEYRLRAVLEEYYSLEKEMSAEEVVCEFDSIIGEETGRGYESEFALHLKAGC